jgi:type II secretory pathway pseudopilin PulG
MKNIFRAKKDMIYRSQTGFSLVEVLVACTIITVTAIALMSAASKGEELSTKALRQVQASALMEEGAEAVKSIRDNDWETISDLTLNTNYYLTFDTGTNTWSLGTTPVAEIDGIFTRTVVFSAVNRDAGDDIADSGTLDTGTKKVDILITWPFAGGTNSKSLSLYVANIFN